MTTGPLSYRREAPEALERFCRTEEMRRLRQIGMNCGCEYTSFPLFRALRSYSRFRHSVSAARIVWDFTADLEQTAATLFHDIATPTFAHSVDFMKGDHLRQEATEAGTERMIRNSPEIAALLEEYGLSVDGVMDYHRYPIADNASPRLSADRLEYTLGNLENYGFRSRGELQAYYNALTVIDNEDGEAELAFSDLETALAFGYDALRCSRIYVSDEDRYAMQILSELLAEGIERGVLSENDLYTTEPRVIGLLREDPVTAAGWDRFRSLHEMLRDEDSAPAADRRVIPAKKRCIDPLVAGSGRLSKGRPDFAHELQRFLHEPQDRWICAR